MNIRNTEHTAAHEQDGSDLEPLSISDGSDLEPLPDLPPGPDLEPLRIPEVEIARCTHDLSVKRKEAILARGAADEAVSEAGRLRREYQDLVVASRAAFEAEEWGQIEANLVALDSFEPATPRF